jgi:hypothetical protein
MQKDNAIMASKLTPTQKLYKILDSLEPQVKSIILAGVYQMRKAAEDLSVIGFNETTRLILQKGSYRPYFKNGKKRMSSAPGEPPAAMRGETLEPSIYNKVVSGPNQNPAIAEFGSNASFAKDLEFGTTTTQPRPFIRPAKDKVAAVAASNVARHLKIAYSRKTRSLKGSVFTLDLEM